MLKDSQSLASLHLMAWWCTVNFIKIRHGNIHCIRERAVSPSIKYINQCPYNQPDWNANPCAGSIGRYQKVYQTLKRQIECIEKFLWLITHPRLTSKYALIKMQAPGRNGTNGQRKPVNRWTNKFINLKY